MAIFDRMKNQRVGVWPRKMLKQWLLSHPQQNRCRQPPPHASRKSLGDNLTESLLAIEFWDDRRPPGRVPKGYLAVYVGPKLRRFVIPASYLSVPEFRTLMEQVAEEVGFEQEGGLQIPCCEEEDFEGILARCVRSNQMTSKPKKHTSKNLV
ncbi:auxin-responsive protein SAUR36-like [Rhodamnia argentea]|uniref:Auxin-responsive protein SAUR36-like n=1 Tax=Rhodamnia argentea TaxID=178133 RepID=A0A8B8QII4_9MYRT|nr:auxin-responsive protein SAUR36-like [Rhodamnia argentea]